ncbi:hypothetical protein [Leisingera sp. ANG-Vp]|uniref:hypothetical protein n=1 Tax=Leisingera sp. ANG-Vp TaxID=1577896 RepID=UPI00057C8E48|nr:hypothetical protein [Leisingera sp. ANG-Vp]KIC22485.1 hypothetical protein RA20_00980 [Leisingera sp. ANG-Vp]
MHGTAFKHIELEDGSGDYFEGSAEFCWTASRVAADRETGEPGGWEVYTSIAFALVDDMLYSRDELALRFGKEEVTRIEAYYEEEAFPEELNDFENIYDDEDAKFDPAAILRAAEPFLAIAAE